MTLSPPTVYLVDISGYIFRAYHAVRKDLTTSWGLPTGALYAFTQMMLKLIKEEKPPYLVPVFDVSRRSFRTEIYPAYKANRPPPPPDLVLQFPVMRQVVEALGCPPVEAEGLEADDLIGTLARRLSEEGHPVRIVSSDKDMMQLVTDSVLMLDTWKGRTVGRNEVIERFGVPPERVVDVLALSGDSSDNIPGVPGVGEKTAASLVSQFGSLDQVLEQAGSVTRPKLRENLLAFADQARLSRTLATIKTDADLPFDLNAFQVRPLDPERARPLLERLEFHSLLALIEARPAPIQAHAAIDRSAYRLVTDEEGLSRLLAELDPSPVIAFDTETNACDPVGESPLVGLSFAVGEGRAWYVPVAHRLPAGRQLPKERVLDRLRPLLADPRRSWVMQNAKFDLSVMLSERLSFAGRVDDTMLLSYSEDPSRRTHGLDGLARDHLGHRMISYDEVTGKGKVTFDLVDLDTACRYSAEDADATLRLFHLLSARVKREGLWDLYDRLERPLAPVLMRMEREGIRVDPVRLQTLSDEFLSQIKEMETRILDLAGTSFNINSTQQLAEILFTKLGLPVAHKTKSGFSTDSSVLEKLKPLHPLPGLVLDYRQLNKLRSTYTDALLRLIHPVTGRVHTSFNQTVTLTGRLSSSDPNLQNIPVRTETGRKIRQAFLPREGCVMISADYSQVELRILAHMADDRLLIESFHKGEDIHARTAAEVFNLLPNLVDKEHRRQAKAVNFGIVYGQTPFGLAESLGIPQREARRIIEHYFARYAGVKRFLDGQAEAGRREKKVGTLFGRRIPLTEIDASNASLRSYAERVAVNAPIQGTAADIIKRAMIDLDEEILRRGLKTRMLLQVHDELVFEAPIDEQEEASALIVEKMEHAASLSVPLKVDLGAGGNWDEAH